MPLEWRYSDYELTQGAGGAGTQAHSLGKFCSTTLIGTPDLNSIFADEAGTADRTDYRCVFLVNTDTFPHTNVAVWFSSQVAGGASVQMAIRPEDNTLLTLNTGAWQAPLASTAGGTPDETEAFRDSSQTLVTVTWQTPTSLATALVVGQLPAGYCQGVLVKRVVTNPTDPLPNDGFVVTGAAKHIE